mgnify:CR=1 FL=1|tara:strand:+ start:213 stop:758 length:546 start_codon:yes stop_codon:yes gene_type:complete
MKKTFIFCLLIIAIHLKGQETTPQTSRIDKSTFGVGLGLDYGGFGMNFTTSLHTNIALFGGLGYSFSEIGYGFGSKLRLMSAVNPSRVTPYGIVMYGKQTIVKIENAARLNKSFHGITLGLGTDFSFKPRKKGYWSIGLLFPIRKSEVEEYLNYLKNVQGVTFSNDLSPVLFSFGYKLILN